MFCNHEVHDKTHRTIVSWKVLGRNHNWQEVLTVEAGRLCDPSLPSPPRASCWHRPSPHSLSPWLTQGMSWEMFRKKSTFYTHGSNNPIKKQTEHRESAPPRGGPAPPAPLRRESAPGWGPRPGGEGGPTERAACSGHWTGHRCILPSRLSGQVGLTGQRSAGAEAGESSTGHKAPSGRWPISYTCPLSYFPDFLFAWLKLPRELQIPARPSLSSLSWGPSSRQPARSLPLCLAPPPEHRSHSFLPTQTPHLGRTRPQATKAPQGALQPCTPLSAGSPITLTTSSSPRRGPASAVRSVCDNLLLSASHAAKPTGQGHTCSVHNSLPTHDKRTDVFLLIFRIPGASQ